MLRQESVHISKDNLIITKKIKKTTITYFFGMLISLLKVLFLKQL